GITMQPAIVLDFALELAGGPAGIAQREDRVLGPAAPGDRLEDVDGGGQANAVVDLQRRILDEEIAGMQHEAATGLDRAAAKHLHALGVFRQFYLLGLLDDVELHQQTGEIDAARRAVDDDSHRALGRMRAEIDHRTLEPRIVHHRHRDQDLAVEIAAASGREVADAGNLAARTL